MRPFKYLACDDIDLISVKIYNYVSSLSNWFPHFVGQRYLDNLDVIETNPELKQLLKHWNLRVATKLIKQSKMKQNLNR